jgi:hypothetical protein
VQDKKVSDLYRCFRLKDLTERKENLKLTVVLNTFVAASCKVHDKNRQFLSDILIVSLLLLRLR